MFKVDDAVICKVNGAGRVIKVQPAAVAAIYAVRVEFSGGWIDTYTLDGKLCATHKLPSLARVDDATDTEEATAAIYADFVASLTKTGITFNNQETHLIHMIMGASGETGELLDAIKKHVIYKQELDLNNVIEELGITRAQTLSSNINKLLQRYPNGSYSDTAAQERKDKSK